MNEQRKLMNRIQNTCFVIQETALYLDTHPQCRKALRYYNIAIREREDAIRQYEARFGPVSIHGNQDENCWRWVTEPWPWEC